MFWRTWEPHSPDLKPIKRLWDVLVKQVRSTEVFFLQDLKDLGLMSSNGVECHSTTIEWHQMTHNKNGKWQEQFQGGFFGWVEVMQTRKKSPLLNKKQGRTRLRFATDQCGLSCRGLEYRHLLWMTGLDVHFLWLAQVSAFLISRF